MIAFFIVNVLFIAASRRGWTIPAMFEVNEGLGIASFVLALVMFLAGLRTHLIEASREPGERT